MPGGAATLNSLRVQAVGLIVPKVPSVPNWWVMAGGIVVDHKWVEYMPGLPAGEKTWRQDLITGIKR